MGGGVWGMCNPDPATEMGQCGCEGLVRTPRDVSRGRSQSKSHCLTVLHNLTLALTIGPSLPSSPNYRPFPQALTIGHDHALPQALTIGHDHAL